MNSQLQVKVLQLTDVAKDNSQNISMLKKLEQMPEDIAVIEKAKQSLLRLLDISKDANTLADQQTPQYVYDGIDQMFIVMEHNKAYTSAPRNEKDRDKFYKNLSKGYLFLANTMEDELSKKTIDVSQVYSCLEYIGDGGYACAERWRHVLEDLLSGYSHVFKNQHNLTVSKEDAFNQNIKELFAKATEIEANRLAEKFIKYLFSSMHPQNKIHYVDFYKRFLVDRFGLPIPVMGDKDSFIQRDEELLTQKALEFTNLDLFDHVISKRFISLFQDVVKTNYEMYERVLDFANKKYQDSNQKHRYEDATDFIGQEVFYGFSKDIRKHAVYQLILEKGFVKEVAHTYQIDHLLKEMIHHNRFKDIDAVLRKVPFYILKTEGVMKVLQSKNSQHHNLLTNAVIHQELPLVNSLLRLGVTLNSKDSLGSTALMWSVVHGSIEIVNALLEAGADINAKNVQGYTALTIAAVNGSDEVIKKLLSYQPKLNERDFFGKTPLHWAIAHGNDTSMKILIQAGAKLNVKDEMGKTPLMYAVEKEDIDMVRTLISKGANIYERDKDGENAFSYAVIDGNIEIAREFLKHGIDVNERKDDGFTALMAASVEGHTEIVKLLLKNKAKVNLKDQDGNTALMYAASCGCKESVKELILHGANIKEKNIFGETAKDQATTFEHLEIVRFLEKQKQKSNTEEIQNRPVKKQKTRDMNLM